MLGNGMIGYFLFEIHLRYFELIEGRVKAVEIYFITFWLGDTYV